MRSEIITTTQRPGVRSWPQAYVAFLLSSSESIVLKVAPVLLLIGAPEVIASNLLPIIGEISDLGDIVLWVIVVARTFTAVSRYLKRD